MAEFERDSEAREHLEFLEIDSALLLEQTEDCDGFYACCNGNDATDDKWCKTCKEYGPIVYLRFSYEIIDRMTELRNISARCIVCQRVGYEGHKCTST